MRFIVDTQLPPALSKYLNSKHFNATHTFDYPSAEFLKDTEIRTIAKAEQRIIITKDSDFYDFYMVKSFPPKVLIIQLGNISNKELIGWFNNHLEIIANEFQNLDTGMLVCTSTEIIVY